jgi:hypothetical protein
LLRQLLSTTAFSNYFQQLKDTTCMDFIHCPDQCSTKMTLPYRGIWTIRLKMIHNFDRDVTASQSSHLGASAPCLSTLLPGIANKTRLKNLSPRSKTHKTSKAQKVSSHNASCRILTGMDAHTGKKLRWQKPKPHDPILVAEAQQIQTVFENASRSYVHTCWNDYWWCSMCGIIRA